MKVAVISDIHDQIWNLERALQLIQAEAEILICCGDFCSPFVIDRMGRGFTGPIHAVFGNNDGDRFRLALKASAYSHFTLHGEFAELNAGGKSFCLNHFDNIGRALAASGSYDVVCFGHNHRYEVRREGSTLLINPGEIMGGLSDGQIPTFAIYDTETDKVSRIVV